MPTPSAIKLHKASRTLELRYGEQSYSLSAEFLRVHSPSAEVQGHGRPILQHGKLNVALDHPPYNLMLTTAPTRTPRHDEWNTIEQDFRWHIEIIPRLYSLGGIELATGCWINSVWPEVAAGFLRSTPESIPFFP